MLLFVGLAAVAATGCRTDSKTAAASDTAGTKATTVNGTIKSRTVNHAPRVSGTPPASVKVGQVYAFAPKASDVDRDMLKFSIVNLPPWANFDPQTGGISGTPQAGAEGTYADIVLSVSDGTNVEFLPMFQVTVVAAPASGSSSTSANSLPTISGTPATSARAGQPYTFAPSASDPDGQALKFSIANKPAWATFDTATGALSGTPSDADIGSSSGITISVSDGVASVSMSAFAVTVAAAGSGWATLSWVPPTENVDGTPLTDLAGYRIHYGKAADSLNTTVEIPGAAMSTATIEGLPAGTWYFAVKAYTVAKVESELSNVAYKVIL